MNITATATLSTISATATIGHTINAGGGDTTPPTFSTAPASASVDDTSFNITATLNEWGTVYSLVQAAAAAAPSIATVIATGESAIDTGSGVTISHTGLTGSTDYTAYVVAKDDDNNTQAALTEVDVRTLDSYDADTIAWYSAGSFIDANKDIMDTFVLNLKTGLTNATNVWSDAIGLYVSCWGADSSAPNNAINGKNPGTYNLIFVNSPTQGISGTTYNGSTQYARTGIIPSSHTTLNDVTLSVYLSNNLSENTVPIGCYGSASTIRLSIFPKDGTGNFRFYAYDSTGGGGFMNPPNADSSQLMTAVRRSATDQEVYRNTISLGTNSGGGGTRPPVELYIGANNNNGSAGNFSSNEIRVALVANGLSVAQVQDWHAAVAALMTDLGI